MVWPPRYGTTSAAGGASQRPPERDENSEAPAGRFAAGELQVKTPLSGFEPVWAAAAAYVWQSQPTEAQIRSSWFEYAPETAGLARPVLSLAQVIWPTNTIVGDTLGLFVYSRPAGSVSWRSNTIYLPYTDTLHAYKGYPVFYRSNINVVTTDEYQVRAKYYWLPASQEVSSEILAGTSSSPYLLLRGGELATNSSEKPYRLLTRKYDYATFVNDALLSYEDTLSSKNVTPAAFRTSYSYAVFADNKEQSIEETLPTATTAGRLLVGKYSYVMFTG